MHFPCKIFNFLSFRGKTVSLRGHTAHPASRRGLWPWRANSFFFLLPPASADVTNLLPRALPRILHNEFIGHKRDKFAVCRLIILGIDVVSEQLVDVFNFAARPGDLNRMANRTFHLGRGGIKALRRDQKPL